MQRRCRATYLPGHAAALPIAQVFVPIYVLEDPTAGHCFDVTRSHMSTGRFRYAERVDALSFVQHPPARQLFLLGKSGAGKTTFLKYLALQALDGTLAETPIYMRLKDWVDADLSLLDFIAQQFARYTDLETHTYVEEMLKDGRISLLLDGLDEIGQAGDARRRVTERLMNFSELYPACRYVIACQNTACEYGFEHFTYAEIADFDMDQIRMFVNRWFQDDSEKRAQLVSAFTKEENRALRDLGRTPLHLALLCLTFEVSPHFPERRFDLYETATEILLKRGDRSPDTADRGLSVARKRELFEHVAALAFREDNGLRQAALEKHLETHVHGEISGAAILDTLKKQQGIFTQRASGVYTFTHKTFHNYFMTRHILRMVSHPDRPTNATLTQLIQHVADDHWHEVFRLTASALDNAAPFFKAFRRAIDGLIRGDEGIEDFLWWATQKAKAVIVDVKPPALRGLYCYLDLALARPLALDHDILRARDLALALARSLDQGLALDLALDLGLNLAFALDRDLADARDRAHIRTMDRALNRVRDSIRTRAGAQAIRENVEEALDLSRALGFTDLQRALAALTIPEDEAPEEIWATFGDDVRKLMITHRGMGRDWTFTKQQSARLAAYFAANFLFVQCLNLASTRQRAANVQPAAKIQPGDDFQSLESNLLLPPGG
jgi:hypothetical protein